MLKGKRVIVDLLPLVPGGANGGAKPFALELVRGLSRLEHRCTFFLLSSERNHKELTSEESDNVRLVNVDEGPKRGLLHRIGIRKRKDLFAELRADMMFCPFTGISFPECKLPVVTVVHDMQFNSYPQFFEEHDLNERIANFESVCLHSSVVVCYSKHVCRSIVETGRIPPDRVRTISIRLSCRLDNGGPNETTKTLEGLKVKKGRYLLYPANFWPHKNHRMLLTAFGMFCSRNPGSDLVVVCTGAPDSRLDDLILARDRFCLKERMHFTGFVSEAELAALYRRCRAVVYPSLYEGFGLPVLEAMSFGKPVVCSNAASLPEVGGDAAIYFDPRKPVDLAAAIEKVEVGGLELERIVEDGYERARLFSDTDRMCREYAEAFDSVLQMN